MLAIIRISGKQYKIKPGDVIEVERIEGKAGDTLSLTEALLAEDNGQIKIGTPVLGDIQAKAKIIGQVKGEKIHVRRFKSKVRSRRHIGFRPQITKLEILSIAAK